MSTTTEERIDAATLRDWLGQPDPVTVIDVRSPAEFETVHLDGSYNMPLNLIEGHTEQLAARLNGQVVLVCQSGVRATQAQQRLAGVGAERVSVLEGGISGFGSDDPRLLRGRPRWAMERQVRLVAGTLVLTGLVAGLRLPKARLLAAGIGTGLTISALTDTCTMGRLLAMLPYNQGPAELSAAEALSQLPG
ncbi:MAG TPA: rhodanese-like domain-containing protein [Pseudonocardia sp.]